MKQNPTPERKRNASEMASSPECTDLMVSPDLMTTGIEAQEIQSDAYCHAL